MKDTEYAYAVARVRALENNLLSGSDIELLLTTKHVEDCIRILSDKGYEIEGGHIEQIFQRELGKTHDLLHEIAPDPAVFDIFSIKNDYHNLKVVLKGLSTGKDFEQMLLPTVMVDVAVIKEAVTEDNFSLLPDQMAFAAQEAYELLNRQGDSQLASVVIDKASELAFYEGAKETENSFILSLVRLMIDCNNVKTALRCAMMGKSVEYVLYALPDVNSVSVRELAANAGTDLTALKEYLYGTEFSEGIPLLDKDFSLFEKWCDDLILQKVMQARFKAFGPEPILAYLFAKETEVKAAHIILTGKANHVEEEMIRGRLRMLYV